MSGDWKDERMAGIDVEKPTGPLDGVNVAFPFSSIRIRERTPPRGPHRTGMSSRWWPM